MSSNMCHNLSNFTIKFLSDALYSHDYFFLQNLQFILYVLRPCIKLKQQIKQSRIAQNHTLI